MYGRPLTDDEKLAWYEYEEILDRYHKLCRVKMYDRPSIHKAFPEIGAAFEKCCKATKHAQLLEKLTKDYDENEPY